MIRPPPRPPLFPYTPLFRSRARTARSTADPSPHQPRAYRGTGGAAEVLHAPRDGPSGTLRAPAHHRVSRRRCRGDRKSTRLNSSHGYISYAVFCLKKKKKLCELSTLFKVVHFHLPMLWDLAYILSSL